MDDKPEKSWSDFGRFGRSRLGLRLRLRLVHLLLVRTDTWFCGSMRAVPSDVLLFLTRTMLYDSSHVVIWCSTVMLWYEQCNDVRQVSKMALSQVHLSLLNAVPVHQRSIINDWCSLHVGKQRPLYTYTLCLRCFVALSIGDHIMRCTPFVSVCADCPFWRIGDWN